MEKMSLFIARKKKGSMTLEAAAVLPLFLFFFLTLFVFFQVLHVQGRTQASLTRTAKELAVLSYDQEEGNQVFSSAYVYGKLLADCPQSYREQMGAGLFWLDVSFREEQELIGLEASTLVENYFPLPVDRKLGAHADVWVRAWTGYEDGAEIGGGTKGDVVYKTISGEVYHTDPNCSYLNPSISAVLAGEVTAKRNLDGEKYRPCELCGGTGSGTVYITDTGNRYHSSPGCSGLKRTILEVPAEEARGGRFCSKCGQSHN